jgi:putative DNA primase/helicase
MSGKTVGTGPDDRGLSGWQLIDGAVAVAAPDFDEESREVQVARVRGRLEHPKGGVHVDDDTGEKTFLKPPKTTLRNLRHILRHDPALEGLFRLNQHSEIIEYRGAPLKDSHVSRIRVKIAYDYKAEFSVNLTQEQIVLVAEDNGYHPVRDYLRALKWDGRPRTDDLLSVYAGCSESELNSAISSKFLISAVARIIEPGCKVDTVLILVGKQGYGKSTFFRDLASSPWFKDTALDLGNKDALIALRGAWIYELAELDSVRTREATKVKAFISAQEDDYRPPYARNNECVKRQLVFVGSTNEETFLNDPTGARRYWPVQADRPPDLGRLGRDRDQLWAEAVHRYSAGERHWLDAGQSAALVEAQERFQHEDPWQQAIEEWLSSRGSVPVTALDVLTGAVKMDIDKQGKHHEMRVGGILTRLGYARRRVRESGRRVYKWANAGTPDED